MEALRYVNPEKVLFLDIETSPQYPDYGSIPPPMRELWDLKSRKLRRDEEGKERSPAESYSSAGIYAEFGKVISITVGMFSGRKFRMKTFFGDDERIILEEFSSLLTKHYNTVSHYLCAHNGKEFDFPFLARRILVNGLKLPKILDLSGKKPWEVRHLDTMELWKFGDYKNYTSLNLLAHIFGIPSPKDDIDGSMIYKVYWEQKDWDRIIQYNRKDVLTVAQLFQRFKGEPLIPENDIQIS